MELINILNSYIFSIPVHFLLPAMVLFMGAVGFAAWKKKTLTADGALAAVVCGVVVLYCLRLEGFILFLFFFLSCNLIGKISGKKTGPEGGFEKKGSCRDWVQVAANGLMAVVSALWWLSSRDFSAVIMFGAAIAESTSDTFAGEIGRMSRINPVSIRNMKPVEKGMSGGVTPLGFAGGVLGALAIAVLWFFLFPVVKGVSYALIICVSAVFGCVADSFLGATAQALYFDRESGKFTERDTDRNGQPLELCRGVKWLDNDMVNLSCNILAAVLSVTLTKIV